MGSHDPRAADERTAETRRLYATVADTYASALRDASAESPRDLALIDEFIAAIPAGAAPVLDAGCGTGRMLGHLAARGVAPLVGVDLSPEMLAHAGRARPEVPLAVADLRRLPFADGSVRAALCWYAIIHAPEDDVETIAAELARVLLPGAPTLLGFQAGTGERVSERAYGHDVTLRGVLHEPARIADLLRGAGLEVLAVERRDPVGHERQPQGFVLARR
ncbi:class I SAM-dependent methyltransferase [Microbacterium marinilacus]|uniref:Class I SAM-dependent methyltransferase n=1 Tax=Microbacterium marinilacus TaxID=415209 RepID=A0ABP7BPQ4_9MICO|nr:class I SAM-dependent methyltransferase [Microbacterium marinilacus]MBY0689861.1 class I SAM-dependent methyltransferase [Microbacterium marinilacus]